MTFRSTLAALTLTLCSFACSDDGGGSLDERFVATMAAQENAWRDQCRCIEDPQSGYCQANPASCNATMEECMRHVVLDADYRACFVTAMKIDEATSRTALECLDGAIAEMQKCIDEANCGASLGECERAYLAKNLRCFEMVGNDVAAAIRQCDNPSPGDLTKPGLDGGT